jgi:hypothetical protein
MKHPVDLNKLTEFLGKKTIQLTCPVCQTKNNWSSTKNLYQVTEFQTDNWIGQGNALPVLPLTCENCGNIVFINAIKAGLIDPKKDL